jgi:Uma2 family endonuclease
MAAQPAALTLEEFHRLYDGAKPVYEYWHGEAIRKPRPTVLHGIVQIVLAILLDKAGWNTAPEVRLKVVPEIEPVPDLIAVRGKFKGRYPAAAPELCVEIMCPSDTLAKTLEKAKQYIAWGSQQVWIIDLEKRTAWDLSAEAAGLSWIPLEGALRIAETAIDLAVLFAEVDKKLEFSRDRIL